MYFLIFESHAFSKHYHVIFGNNLLAPMHSILQDFGTAEEIGQLMGGN